MRKFALVLVVFGSLALAGCSNFAPLKSNDTAACSAATTCSAAAAECGGCPIAAAAAKKACGDDCSKPCCADK